MIRLSPFFLDIEYKNKITVKHFEIKAKKAVKLDLILYFVWLRYSNFITKYEKVTNLKQIKRVLS